MDIGRIRRVLFQHHALAWRTLRRFGVSRVRVDEAVSRVFDVLVRRLDDVDVEKEHAFIINVCTRVASEFRRAEAARARLEEPVSTEIPSSAPSPEDLVGEKEERALLDTALDSLDPEFREVFVLHELEQMTMAEIAEALGIRSGTVASRLRRAREQFEQSAVRLRRRLNKIGGQP